MRFAPLASLVASAGLFALVGCSSSSGGAIAADTGTDDGITTFRPEAGPDSASADSGSGDTASSETSDADASDASDAGAQTIDVQVGAGGSMTFSPPSVTIHVGDTVRWTWEASGHNVVSGTSGTADGKFCSPNDTNCSSAPTSATGFVYSHTFTTAGAYPYFCTIHFAAGMTGTVTVQ